MAKEGTYTTIAINMGGTLLDQNITVMVENSTKRWEHKEIATTLHLLAHNEAVIAMHGLGQLEAREFKATPIRGGSVGFVLAAWSKIVAFGFKVLLFGLFF